MASMVERLRALQENAYAPYSKFKVACLLKLSDGKEFVGVNVENAAYGSTICAERAAFVSAVSQLGKTNFDSLHLLAGDGNHFGMPCGECRQFMRELVDEDFFIHVYQASGESKCYTIGQLLPDSFSSEDLS